VIAASAPSVAGPAAPISPVAVEAPKIDAVATPPSVAPEKPAESKPFDLGSVVDSIDIPQQEQVREVAPVDLKKIKPVAPKVEETPKGSKVASSPARIWVQIATGADVNSLAFEYRRLSKKSPALFSNLGGYTAVWTKMRRLVVGPFTDMKSAKKWEADFRKNGGDGFVWTSENGAVVDPLKGK
jgi:hypothetical protein